MRQRILMLLLLTGLLGAATTTRAERKLVDRVVAVVEDEAILQSDVEQTIKQYMVVQNRSSLTNEERTRLETDALQELVNSKLVLAQAKRLGIDVSFAEVERAVDKAIDENRQTLGGEEAFQRQLKKEGLTLDELRQLYREQLRNRMLVDRVLAREVSRSSIQITEDDLHKAYDTRKDELPARPAVVHLRTIYISLDSSESARDAAKLRITQLRERITAGEDFGDIARKYSEDPSAERGGSLGRLRIADLADSAFAAAASALEVGEVSEPVETPFGYHLIQITGVDSESGEVELRHILVRVKPEEKDIRSVFARATAIRDELEVGASFDSLAMQQSDDEATASVGGDLGWLRVNDLPEFFRDVLSTMKEGDISPVLREPTGFRIVQLLGREAARPYAFDEVRDELRRLVEQERMEQAYTQYVAGLRDQFYVDIRSD